LALSIQQRLSADKQYGDEFQFMTLSLPAPVVTAALIAVVFTAAAFDVRYRRIPNWLSVCGVVLGIGLNASVYGGLPGVAFALKGMALGFSIYFVLYALHAMGAGDVKLMAAVGALVGWQDWVGVFFAASILGGILALIVVVRRGRVRRTFRNVAFILSQMMRLRPAHLAREELDVRSPQAVSLPHGAVIAVAILFFLSISAHFIG
jgi:prepilin peptidase CpaA